MRWQFLAANSQASLDLPPGAARAISIYSSATANAVSSGVDPFEDKGGVVYCRPHVDRLQLTRVTSLVQSRVSHAEPSRFKTQANNSRARRLQPQC